MIFNFKVWVITSIFSAFVYTAVHASGIDEYTKLLIQSDTIGGDLSFWDVSGNNHIVSPIGEVNHSASQSKFGTTSIYFDGDSDYLESPHSSDWDFGSGDFTIDFWLYYQGWGGLGSVVNFVTSGGSGTQFNTSGWTINSRIYNGAFLTWESVEESSTVTISTSTEPPANTWAHVAIVRESGTVMIFLNGELLTSGTDTHNINSSQPILIGITHEKDGRYLKGFIDEFRISKGIARWTASFTPPTRAIDATPPDFPIVHPENTEIQGALRITPQPTTPVNCSEDTEGTLYYSLSMQIPMICDGTTWNEYAGPQGIKGQQGIQGDIGPQGPAGNDSPFSELSCSTDQIIRYNGTAWVCAEDISIYSLSCSEGDTIKFTSGTWACAND